STFTLSFDPKSVFNIVLIAVCFTAIAVIYAA
ncbi:unnamed protein product, partial [marine sediment metagenome]